MTLVGFLQKLPRIACLALPFGFFAVSAAKAQFLDDSAALTKAISEMRLSFAAHPRVLKVEIDNKLIEMEVQDPANRSHIDRWTYRIIELGPIQIPRMSGPTPVEPQLIDPDLEANLFNLDDIDFSAAGVLEIAAIHRANMQDPAGITRMEIARRVHILPSPKADVVQWSLHISSGRESADVYADAKGNITGADLSETRNAKTLNLFKDPGLVATAIKTFRETVGAKPIVLSVSVEQDSVGFSTNETDSAINKIMTSMKSNASYFWNLSGLQRRMGTIAMPDVGIMKQPAPFSIDEIDWTTIGKLAADALAKVPDPKAEISDMRLEKTARHRVNAVLEWTISIADSDGATSKVYADAQGTITSVVLPPGKQPAAAAEPVSWLDPATMAGALSRLGADFQPESRIIEIEFSDDGGHIILEDVIAGGKFRAFDFTPTGIEPDDVRRPTNPNGARFHISDLAGLDTARLTALKQAAMQKLAAGKKGYLSNLAIGSNKSDPEGRPEVIKIFLRDSPVGSATSNYAWALYNFEGKYIDGDAF